MKIKNILILEFAIIFLLGNLLALAKPANKLQAPESSTFVVDSRSSTLSKVEFAINSNGVVGLANRPVPRGIVWKNADSNNHYLFGAGIIFAGKKLVNDTLRVFSEHTYDVNSGLSMMVPGRIEDADTLVKDIDNKYIVYVSSNYDGNTGVTRLSSKPYSWPLWQVRYNAQTDKKGSYVYNQEKRNITEYPQKPSIISDQDFFCTYKDTDYKRYGGDTNYYIKQGLPARIQYEQTVYSWSSEAKQNFIIVRYNIINFSDDTLYNCIVAPVFDPDITLLESYWFGVNNDRCSYSNIGIDNMEFKYCYCWTETDAGEFGKKFGYLGLALLETPSVNNQGILRNDKIEYKRRDQTGLHGFIGIDIDDKIYNSDTLYNMLAKPGDNLIKEPSDQRLALPSGSFTMPPGDTARLAFLIAFAMPAVFEEATGQKIDLSLLEKEIKAGFAEYHSFFDPSLSVAVSKQTEASGLEFSISPQPASDEVKLSIFSEIGKSVYIQIYDLAGRLIYQTENIALYPGMNEVDMQLELNSGVYSVIIRSDTDSKTGLLLINK